MGQHSGGEVSRANSCVGFAVGFGRIVLSSCNRTGRVVSQPPQAGMAFQCADCGCPMDGGVCAGGRRPIRPNGTSGRCCSFSLFNDRMRNSRYVAGSPSGRVISTTLDHADRHTPAPRHLFYPARPGMVALNTAATTEVTSVSQPRLSSTGQTAIRRLAALGINLELGEPYSRAG
jgi:hypothetical protein